MKNSKLLLASLLVSSIILTSLGFTNSDEWIVPAKYKTMENPYAGSTDDYGMNYTRFTVHRVMVTKVMAMVKKQKALKPKCASLVRKKYNRKPMANCIINRLLEEMKCQTSKKK